MSKDLIMDNFSFILNCSMAVLDLGFVGNWEEERGEMAVACARVSASEPSGKSCLVNRRNYD